jgi:hypothetical protein
VPKCWANATGSRDKGAEIAAALTVKGRVSNGGNLGPACNVLAALFL